MSWLSQALSKSKVGRAVNAVGGPLTNIAGKITGSLPVVGSIQKGVEAVGDYIPNPFGGSTLPTTGPVNAGGAAFGLGPEAIAAILKAGGGGQGLPGMAPVGGGADPWLKALAVAQGVNTAALGKQSTEAAKEAVKYTTGEWDRRAPLRAQGVAGMDAGVAPVRLPGLAAISRSGNPFARVG